MNQRQMRQLGLTQETNPSPARAKKRLANTQQTKPSQTLNAQHTALEPVIEKKAESITVKSASEHYADETNSTHITTPTATSTSSRPSRPSTPFENSIEPEAPAVEKPTLDKATSIQVTSKQASIKKTPDIVETNPSPSSATAQKKLPSKEIQYRIEQACLFVQVEPTALLTDSEDADFVRELVIGSISESIKINGATRPILTMLLHCTSEHLTLLLNNVKRSNEKKLSIQLFRQLQSDLQPPYIE